MGVLGTVIESFGRRSTVVRTAAEVNALSDKLRQEQESNLLLMEGMADLELAMEDRGWERILGNGPEQFSRAGLGRSAALCRLMVVANPLMKRGIDTRIGYIFGSGVEVTGRATGENGEQDVNGVVQEFWNDPSNRASLTGDQAHEELERAHATDGNTFLACFTTPRTGRVQVRSIPFEEITDIISNPDDRDEPWFYRRQWTQHTLNARGDATETIGMVAYYPDLRYNPRQKQKSIDGYPVIWNAPIYHTSVNRLDGWQFGIGDGYAALPWARAYKEFLEDWATLVKSLSRFAWRAVSNTKSKAQKMRNVLQKVQGNAIDPNTGRDIAAGGTAVSTNDATLEPIPKSGATIDSDSGKPLASMIAAALGLPVTVLLSDPGQTGNRATAETLNKPTQLVMEQRRSVWEEAYKAILQYVIDQAVVAPLGRLQGSTIFDTFTRRNVVVLASDTDRTIEVTWPNNTDDSMKERVDAIVAADGTGKMPPLTVARLLLQVLGVEDVDTLLKDLTDDDGNFIDPFMNAAQNAVDAFRRGQDPAAAL